MNNFIITILYLALGSCFALSAPIKVHQDLERPPYPEAVKLPDNIAFKLALLLDEGKLEEFYQAAFRELEKIDDESEKDADKKRGQSQLWLFYYIAGAPFFQMDAQPDHMISWSRSRLLDYLTKISAVRYMAYFNPDTSDQDTVIPNSLCADYCARIIKDMRLSYIPNLDAKQQKEEKEFLGKTRELLNNKKLDFRNYRGGTSCSITRQARFPKGMIWPATTWSCWKKISSPCCSAIFPAMQQRSRSTSSKPGMRTRKYNHC